MPVSIDNWDALKAYGKALVKDMPLPSARKIIVDGLGVELPWENEYLLIIPHLTLQGKGSYSDSDHSKTSKVAMQDVYNDFVMQLIGIGFDPIGKRIIDGELLTSTLVGFRLTGMVVMKEITIAKAMEFKLTKPDAFPVALSTPVVAGGHT